MIIIDRITSARSPAGTTLTFDHLIKSPDELLLIAVFIGGTTTTPLVTVNGTSLNSPINAQGPTSTTAASFWATNVPPVGMTSISISVSGAGFIGAVAFSILGVKKRTNYNDFQNWTGAVIIDSATNSPVLTPNPVSANALVLDAIFASSSTPATALTPDASQTQVLSSDDAHSDAIGVSYKYVSPGSQNMAWTFTGTSPLVVGCALVLEPSDAPSIWYPTVNQRSQFDVARTNALDVGVDSVLTGIWGYFPSQFYQNSFLHTIGRNLPPSQQYVSSPHPTSQIIIDNISSIKVLAGVTVNIPHRVSSQDAILVVLVGAGSSNVPVVSYNGVRLTSVVGAGDGNANQTNIFVMLNPPVGVYPLVASVSTGSFGLSALTILGVSKRAGNFIVASSTNGTGGRGTSVSISPAQANSLILDVVALFNTLTHAAPGIPSSEQTQIADILGATNGSEDFLASFKIAGPGQQMMSWTYSNSSNGQSQSAIVLEPAQAPSFWFPNIDPRNILDVIATNALDVPLDQGTSPKLYGYKPAIFYKNSFLHTVGRLVHPPSPATIVSETEQETSQIIVDKVFQGQLGGGGTLNLQVSIPSQDAVLVVTGGSVVATGGSWQSVTLNGVSLLKLVQAGIVGNSAEIWYLPNPPVGTSTLSIVPTATFGQVYANAMVLLGIDKKDTNIIAVSTTDAASTSVISALVTPDAPNSLIIDTVVTLNPVAKPDPDPSQTQVFNAPSLNANEAVVSTYKLASSQTQMSHDLSTSVNATLVAVSFRPAQAPSFWFPNIDTRQIDDVVTVASLDVGVTPIAGSYGYKPSIFWQNSFLHTIGRLLKVQQIITTTQTITGVSRIQQVVSKVITGVTRIQEVVNQTITGISRIQQIVNQTLAGVSRIQEKVNQTITGKSAIRETTTQTVTGKSRIQEIVNQTIAGISRITATASQAITGKSSIRETTTQTTTGKSRIQEVVSQTITGISRIQEVVSKTLTGVSRIQEIVNQTKTGISRITATTVQTITGKSSIRKTTIQTITGVSRIQELVSRTITGVSRIQEIVNKSLNGVSRIQEVVNQIITGVSQIREIVNQTITGKSAIRETTMQIVTGVSRIQEVVNKTLTGISRITAKTNQVLMGITRIQEVVSQTISGVSRITVTTAQIITGISRIQEIVNQTITGVAHIGNPVSTQQITGISRIQEIVNKTLSGISRVRATVTQTLTGITRIQETVDKIITGKSRITVTVSQTISGITRIREIVSQTIMGVSRIQEIVNRMIVGISRIQESVLQTVMGKSRIREIVNQTISGISRVTATTNRTILGVANIFNTTTKTILGVARIRIIETQTITGVSRIGEIVNQTLTGVSRITATVAKTIIGKAAIRETITRTINGQTRIQEVVNKAITGISRITARTNQTLTGKARITATTNRTIFGIARIRETVVKIIQGVSRIQLVINENISGESRITASTLRTVVGVSRMQETASVMIAGVSRIHSPPRVIPRPKTGSTQGKLVFFD